MSERVSSDGGGERGDEEEDEEEDCKGFEGEVVDVDVEGEDLFADDGAEAELGEFAKEEEGAADSEEEDAVGIDGSESKIRYL